VAPAVGQVPEPFVTDALLDLELAAGGPIQETISPTTGLVTFLAFTPHQRPLVKLSAEAPAEERAAAFLDDFGAAFGIGGRDWVSLTRSSALDEVGMEHVRFRQIHQGVPVTGGELVVHLRGSAVVAVNARTLAGLETIGTLPTMSAAEATMLVTEALEQGMGVTGAELSEPRLELLNKGLLGGRGFATELTWFIEARKTDLREFIWIDALHGKLRLQFSQLTDALAREIYDTGDPEDGVFDVLPGILERVEGGAATGDPDADDAYDFSGDTYDYFFNVHGRDSYDDAGGALLSSVHFCPSADNCPYPNAFWNGTQMVYGEGLSRADDVDAHELAHAVTEKTADLFYYMQSGALNESYSDIFGETVDQGNLAGDDSSEVRWQIGEDIPAVSQLSSPLRNMMEPTLLGDPGKTSDAQFVCGSDYRVDRGGVHSNSGVPNHAYALMVDGGTYNGKTVTLMGLNKAGKIQYRALANYLTSASDFLDNYNALKQACQDLIGTAGITAADCSEVGDALDAVELSATWPCSPAQAPAPALCSAGQAPSLWFSWDVESSGLTPCPPSGLPANWCLNQPSSLLGAFATSGVRSYWGYNRGSVAALRLVVPTTGTLPADARMQFNHAHGFENVGPVKYYDGGVVEYSTDGGATWIDAGSKIVAGQTYGGTVDTCCGNPLAGSSAFVADTWGYTATQLDLSALAGQGFWSAFHIGTDASGDEYGWFVDDIRIYTCTECVFHRVLNAAYNGLAPSYRAVVSIEAGAGFGVGAMESVMLQAPEVRLTDDFDASGQLTISNTSCP
jgi:Zn-dependent metalloprotease